MCFNVEDKLFLESFAFVCLCPETYLKCPRIGMRMQSVLVLVTSEVGLNGGVTPLTGLLTVDGYQEEISSMSLS